MQLFDTHAHYNDEKFEEDRDSIIQEIFKTEVKRLFCVGYNVPSSEEAIKIANQYEPICAIVGISPNDIEKTEEEVKRQISQIKKLATQNKVVGIGEIGLDYYWNQDNKELQKQAFIEQIQVAHELNLPITIHTRDAIFDTLTILKQQAKYLNKVVIHCTPLNVDLIKEGLKLGVYFSFAGPITYKNSKNATEIISMVPLEKIVIETDSPYLSPEPNRGKRNDSRNVKYVAEKIAQIKQLPIETIAKITYENAEKIWG